MLTIEKNSDKFIEEKLIAGQRRLAECVQKIAQEIRPGMNEKNGTEIAQKLLTQNGFGKNWHPHKIRFGPNTLKIFSDISDKTIVLGKPNGELVDPFYIAFVAADRSQASQGYFFPVEGKPNEYIRFEDFTFDGTVNINQVVKENVTKVERSKTGSLMKIENAVLPKLGTTKYTEANITVTEKATVIEGIQRDKADPKFEVKATTEYLRTKLGE